MAAQPVTPQRVRDILSTFIYESEKRSPQTSVYFRPEKFTSPENGKRPRQPGSQSGSPGSDTISPEVASNRRTFASFLMRVETFSPITWFAKPPELCPLVCSRFGWENTEYDMLHCTACSANLCSLLPAKSDITKYKKACKDLEKKLLTAHEKFCTLAVNPCPEAFLKVGLHDVEELRKSFLQRVSALRGSAHHLPDLVYTQLETWGFAESHAAKFCAEEDMSESETQVITLAITGWTVRENNEQIIFCCLCRRQIGLWNFTPAHGKLVSNGSQKDVGENGDDADSEGDSGPPSKMRKIERQSMLDPISSHHAWCPWIALRMASEDAMTLLPLSPPNTTSTTSPPSTPASSAASSLAAPVTPANSRQSPTTPLQDRGGSPGEVMGGGGDAGSVVLSQKQPAWVMVVRMVAPGLLSQSRCLVQRVRQSSIVEGLHCIRKVLMGWSSPDNEKKADLSTSLSASLTTSPS